MNTMHASLKGFAAAAVLSLLLAVVASGEDDFRQKFQTAKQAHDEKQVQAALGEWKRVRPDDPEYFIAAANHVLNAGVTISRKKAAPGDFVIADKAGKAVGSLSAGAPSPDAYKQAVELLKQALVKSPQRIDIYLGLATLYHDMGNPKALVEDLAAMAAYGKAHVDTVQGKDGQPYPRPVDKNLALAINGFAERYFQSDTAESNQAFFDLAKLDAEAFPGCEYGHNLLGVYYTTIDKKPPLALASFERALKIVPNDSLVWNNVAMLHERNGDKSKAREAFQKIVKLNNDADCVEQAKSHLAELK